MIDFLFLCLSSMFGFDPLLPFQYPSLHQHPYSLLNLACWHHFNFPVGELRLPYRPISQMY